VRGAHAGVPFLEARCIHKPVVIPAKAGIHSPVRSQMDPQRQPQ